MILRNYLINAISLPPHMTMSKQYGVRKLKNVSDNDRRYPKLFNR